MTAEMPPRPAGRSVEDSVTIAASPEAVWAVLADVAGWPGWNPVYTEAAGLIGEGDTIRLAITLPGAKPLRSAATVFRALPGRALQFGAPALAGLLHATRYIEIRPDGASCTVVNGETLARPLAPALMRLAGGRMLAGLRLQNAGLKRAAEARAAS